MTKNQKTKNGMNETKVQIEKQWGTLQGISNFPRDYPMQWLLWGFPGTTGATWIQITIMLSLVCLAALAHPKKCLTTFLHFCTHYRSICIKWGKLCPQSEYKLGKPRTACSKRYITSIVWFFCAKLCRHSKLTIMVHSLAWLRTYVFFGWCTLSFVEVFFQRYHWRYHWIAISWRFHGQLNSKVIKRLDSIILVQQFCNNEVEWTVKVYFNKRKKHLYLIFICLDCCIPFNPALSIPQRV